MASEAPVVAEAPVAEAPTPMEVTPTEETRPTTSEEKPAVEEAATPAEEKPAAEAPAAAEEPKAPAEDAAAPAEAAQADKEEPGTAPDAEKSGSAEVPAATAEIQKPKKGASAYWIYSNEAREKVAAELKEKNSGGKTTFGDVAKEVAARWAALPAEEKKPFEQKAAEDKERYDAEMKTYLAALDPAAALRAKYADLIPKKPASAYALFCQDDKQQAKAASALKEAGQDATSTLISKKLQEMWKVVSAADKLGYQTEQKKQHLEFLGKQKAWQSTPEFAEIEKAEKEREEMKKAAEAAKAAKEAEEKAKAAKEKRMAAASKRGVKQVEPKTPEGAAVKKARVTKVANDSPPSPKIDAGVLAEATKAGLESGLKNLAGRPEVLASGKSSRAILDALKASGGLVNPAKRALLGQ